MTKNELPGDFLLPIVGQTGLGFRYEPILELHEQTDALDRAKLAGIVELKCFDAVLAEIVRLRSQDLLTPTVVVANWRGLFDPALRKVSTVVGRTEQVVKNREAFLQRASALAVATKAIGDNLPDELVDAILNQAGGGESLDETARDDSRALFRVDLVDNAEVLQDLVERLQQDPLLSLLEVGVTASTILELLRGEEPSGLAVSEKSAGDRYRPRGRWRLDASNISKTYGQSIQQHLPGRMSFGGTDQQARATEYNAEINAILDQLAETRTEDQQIISRAQHAIVERMRGLGFTVARVLAVKRELPETRLRTLRTLTDEVIAHTTAEAVTAAVRGDEHRPRAEDLSQAITDGVQGTAYKHAKELGITPPRTWQPQPGRVRPSASRLRRP